MKRRTAIRHTLAATPLLFVLVAGAACDEELDVFDEGGISSMLFLPDDSAPSAGSVSLQHHGYDAVGGVNVAVQLTELASVREIRYSLVYDPGVARFVHAELGGHFETSPDGSILETVLESGQQGRLHVRHRIAAGGPAASGTGTPHVINFAACNQSGCGSDSAATGVFVQDMVVLADDGASVAVTISGGRLLRP